MVNQMKKYLSVTPAVMRSINRTAILEHIRDNGKSSRVIIAKDLNLSLPSVVRIIEELEHEKLVRYSGDYEDSGGRKRPLIEFNTEDNITLGLDLGGTKVYACVIDLSGKTLYEKYVPVHNTKSDESYELVVSLIEEMLAFAKTLNKTIRGISLGVPGVTSHRKGEVVFAPSLEWTNMPLKSMLETRFKMPVIVENDVNMAALGEMWYGHGRNRSNIVLIAMGTGLGAGLIVDGCIYRGANEAAGELGYLILEKGELKREYPVFGPLEYAIAGTGLAMQAKEMQRELTEGDESEEYTAKSVFEAYERKEEWALTIIDNFVDKLAMAIIAACAVIDPEVVILSGGVMNSAQFMIDEIQSKVADKLPSQIPIVISQLKSKATILGGAVSLIHQTADYCIIRSMY